MNIPDPNGHLEWIANELQKAEDNEEAVYIMGHIPPGADCMPTWSHQFAKIVNRYNNNAYLDGRFL
jgi:sphingomyelin phosphodiesterase